MTEFVLKNNYFEFDSNVKHQISGTAISTKFAPPYACIYMDYIENQFLKNEQIQPWIWFMYNDDIFFIWTASEKELDDFLEQLNNFHPNLKFTHERSREEINFLDVTVQISILRLVDTPTTDGKILLSTRLEDQEMIEDNSIKITFAGQIKMKL